MKTRYIKHNTPHTRSINSKPSNILTKQGDTHTNKDTCNKDTKRKNTKALLIDNMKGMRALRVINSRF